MKETYPWLLSLALISTACQNTPRSAVQPTLTIFAAASLTEAFQEIGDVFLAEHPGVDLVFNFAGSQQLAQQLFQGAPADVFASADERQMRVAVDSDRVAPGAPQVFAQNYLVVVYPSDNPAGISTLSDLAAPGLRLLLAAPEVPVGGYSQAFLQRASQDPSFGDSFRKGALANVASYEDSVRAVLTKVVLGEADAGIVYASDVTGVTGKVGILPIPAALNSTAVYLITPIQQSANPELASAYIKLVLSPDGQSILARYGLSPVEVTPYGGPGAPLEQR